MPERLIRFRPTFFEDLDSLLADERGRDGRPSATDFLLYELPRLRDQLRQHVRRNEAVRPGADHDRVRVHGPPIDMAHAMVRRRRWGMCYPNANRFQSSIVLVELLDESPESFDIAELRHGRDCPVTGT